MILIRLTNRHIIYPRLLQCSTKRRTHVARIQHDSGTFEPRLRQQTANECRIRAEPRALWFILAGCAGPVASQYNSEKTGLHATRLLRGIQRGWRYLQSRVEHPVDGSPIEHRRLPQRKLAAAPIGPAHLLHSPIT